MIRVLPKRSLIQVSSGARRAERKNFLIGMVGTNRTGKTTEAIKIAKKWRKANPEGNIVAFDPQFHLSEIADFIIDGTVTEDFFMNLRNTLLVLDDFRALHESDKAEPWLNQLLIFRNHWNVDIIYVVHNPSVVLTKLSFFTTHYIIFKTHAMQGMWKKKIPTYVQCNSASNYITKYVELYGAGEYPNFPHAIVDTETNKVSFINIKAK